MKKVFAQLLYIAKLLTLITLFIFLAGFLNGISERGVEYYIIMALIIVALAVSNKVSKGKISLTVQILIGIFIAEIINGMILLNDTTYWILFLGSIVLVLAFNKNQFLKRTES